jgi:hypothetical protein
MSARLIHNVEKVLKNVISGNIAYSPFSPFDLAGVNRFIAGRWAWKKHHKTRFETWLSVNR